MKTNAEDTAMINFMKNSMANGGTIIKSLKSFAEAYGEPYGRVYNRWYGKFTKEGDRAEGLKTVYERDAGRVGDTKRRSFSEEEIEYAMKLLQTKTTREVAEITGINQASVSRYGRLRKVSKKQVPSHHKPVKSERKNSVKGSAIINKISEMNKEVYDKMDTMQDDIRKYVENIEKSVMSELKLSMDVVKKLGEMNKPKTLNVADSGYVNPKYLVDGGGEVKLLNKPVPISYNEDKVNQLITENDKLIINIDTLKEIEGSLMSKLDRVTKLQTQSQKEQAILQNENKDLSDTIQRLTIENETLMSKNQELSSRGVIGRLFNTNTVTV